MKNRPALRFLIIVFTAFLPLACLNTPQTREPWIPPTLSASELIIQSASQTAASVVSSTQSPFSDADQSSDQSEYTAIQEEYIVQPNDTLKGIADMFGVSVEQIILVNNITDPDMIYVGQVLLIPSGESLKDGPDFVIIPDSEFVNSPSAIGFNLADFVKQQNGFITKYKETINKKTYSGIDILQMISLNYSINPRILLAVVEYQTGWITNPAKPSEDDLLYPMGNLDEKRKGFFSQLNWAAGALNHGYYSYKVKAVSGWILKDGTYVPISPNINAGTAAIQHFMAQVYERVQWEKSVSADGVYKTYVQFFGDPSAYTYQPLVPADLTQPSMTLPFEEGTTWSFTGGPHSAWGSGSAWGALDFAPPGEPLGCVISDAWAIAVADGLIVRSEDGSVLLDLDQDGFEQTGWVVLYLHIDSYERVPVGTYVKQNDRIGHPSCEGGVSFGSHLHIARKYNGEWIPADQNLPFNLDGWISEGTGIEYDGYLRRGDQSVEAWNDYVAENQITR